MFSPNYDPSAVVVDRINAHMAKPMSGPVKSFRDYALLTLERILQWCKKKVAPEEEAVYVRPDGIVGMDAVGELIHEDIQSRMTKRMRGPVEFSIDMAIAILNRIKPKK